MCNLSKGVEERGIEKGITQGITQGIAQGIEMGIERGVKQSLLSSIINLMDTLNLSAEQAMDALKIPKNEQNEYKKGLLK